MSGILQTCPRCGARDVRLVWDIQQRHTACTRCQGVERTRPAPSPARPDGREAE